jgi:hypothetical protein
MTQDEKGSRASSGLHHQKRQNFLQQNRVGTIENADSHPDEAEAYFYRRRERAGSLA